MPNNSVTRRSFLAAGAAALTVASARASTGRIRVGLVGPGRYGNELCQQIECNPHAEIVAVHRDSLYALIREKVDAVVIATPDDSHAALSVQALQHGLHVCCAPPMAMTEADANATRDAARAAGRIYQSGVEPAGVQPWQAARALIRSGTIGDVRWCAASGNALRALAPHGTWRNEPDRTHGGAARCVHDLWAACAHITGAGKPTSVSAIGGAPGTSELPTALVVSVDFPGGLHFSLDCNPARNEPESLTIRGSLGSLVVEHDRIRVQKETPWNGKLLEIWRSNGSENLAPIDAWLERIRTGDSSDDSFDIAYHAAIGTTRAMQVYRSSSAA